MIAFFGSINLAGSWATAWTAISCSSSRLPFALAVIGALLAVFAVVEYIRESRRGGRNHQTLIFTIVIGALIGAPGVVVPVILTGVDLIANALIIHLLHSTSSGG